MALLSAMQIGFRQSLEGTTPGWWRVVWTNLLAWAPWPLLAIPIARSWTRTDFKLRDLSTALRHGAGATLVALLYLAYLTLFRFAFFPEATGAPGLANLQRAFATEIGDFFVITWSFYWIIGVAAYLLHARETRAHAAHVPPAAKAPPALRIGSAGRSRWVELDAVECIESDRSYAVVHQPGDTSVTRETLRSLAERLAVHGFHRAHRSWVVNLAKVRELRPTSHGDAALVLVSGRRVPVSRTYRTALQSALDALHS